MTRVVTPRKLSTKSMPHPSNAHSHSLTPANLVETYMYVVPLPTYLPTYPAHLPPRLFLRPSVLPYTTQGNTEDIAKTGLNNPSTAVQTLPRRRRETWPQYGETLAPDLGPTEQQGRAKKGAYDERTYMFPCKHTATCLYNLSVSYSTQPNLGCIRPLTFSRDQRPSLFA